MIIEVLNTSSVIYASEIDAWCEALHLQSQQLAARWRNQVATLKQVTSFSGLNWEMLVTDNADQAGALGYHDNVTPGGLPIMKVFAKTSIQDGVEPSSVASHEMVETLVDPWCDRMVMKDANTFYTYEVGDPVEQFSYGIVVTSGKTVMVSDYVYPNWFDAGSKGPWDRLGKAPAPLRLAPGGSYIGVYKCGSGWNQITADGKLEPVTRKRKREL